MKKVLKISLFIFLSIIVIIAGFFLYCIIISSDAKLDESKFISVDKKTVFYAEDGDVISEDFNGTKVTPISDMPDYLVKAFVSIEDKRFYSHNGVDARGMARALFNNLFSFSFKEGASTISQQLIKNTHYSGEKTLKRKISEIKLAKQLEKKYSKNEIMEKYLNTIYFGNNSYGITAAAENYFDKTPNELTISEAATLAGLIKAPSKYSPLVDIKKSTERRNVVLNEMLSQGYIKKQEFDVAYNEKITAKQKENSYDYLYLAKKEVDAILGNRLKFGSGYRVYTYFNQEYQNTVKSAVNGVNYDYSALITDQKSHVKAYLSTVGDVKRQIGSTIKPILVYAPAIEYNVISPLTPILDEKTDFNGYSPSNYSDKYYGYVSATTALSKSLNVCAVKILNSTGIERSKRFAQNAGLYFTENDKYLNLALGSTEQGVKLSELVSAYNVLSNEGMSNSVSCISKITDKNGTIIYENKENNHAVCSKESSYIVSEMLKETVKSGTAKNLNKLDVNLCAKTGTVGNEKGNSDALTVSYTPDITLGVWIGNADGSLMPNNVTGGTLPVNISSKIWKKLQKYSKKDFVKPENVIETYIDKLSYEKENKIVLADKNAPQRFKIKTIFKSDNLPTETSKRFISPKIENKKISVFNSGILIELCLTELCEAKIYRERNGVKTLIYDTKNNLKEFFDKNLSSGIYVYSAVPYFNYGDEEFLGDETFLQKIAVSKENDDWWLNDIYGS